MNWTIGKKIGFAFALSLALLATITAVTLFSINRLAPATAQKKRSDDARALLDTMIETLLNVHTAAGGSLSTSEEQESFNAANARLFEQLKDLEALVARNSTQQDRVRQLEFRIRKEIATLARIADFYKGDRDSRTEGERDIESGKKDMAEILALISEIKHQEQVILDDRLARPRARARVVSWAIIGTMVAAFLLVALNGIFVVRSISKRTKRVVEGAERIGRGMLGERIVIDSRDEMGSLARTFNQMAANLQLRETALAESERRYRALVSNIPDVTWTADAQNGMRFVSPNILQISGFTAEEIYQAGPAFWLKRIHPDDAEAVRRAYGLLFSGNCPLELEYRVERKDGIWIWINDRAAATYIIDGVKCADGVFCDVTERKLNQEELARFFTVSSSCCCIAGFDGYLKKLNPAFEQVLGYSKDALLTTPFLDFVHPDDRAATVSEVARLSSGVPTISFENRWRCKDETYRWMLWNVAPFPSEGLMFAAGRDITQRKQTEWELERAKKSAEDANLTKSQFLASMSHELRTPLNAIIGFSDLLVEGTFGPLNEKQHRYAGNILQSGRHLLQLINDILDLSKIEAGHMELDSSSFDVASKLREVETIVKGLAHKKQISLSIATEDNGESLPPLVADPKMFKQIMYNLLSNAIKFTPDGGTVHVSARLVPEHSDDGVRGSETPMIEISVTDTGIGIEAKDRGRIFAEFVQLDHSYSRKQEGTGLGLALTRKLVQLHGGTITVDSEVGQGSTFTFRLPVSPIIATVCIEGCDEEPVLASFQASGRRPRVLVVEDDNAAADLLHHYLTEGGYDVAHASSAEEATRLAATVKPDVITLDIVLPKRSGLEFLEEIKHSELQHVPIVVVSITDERALGYSLGAADWLVKPIQREQLLNSLSKVLPKGSEQTVLVIDDDYADREYVSEIVTRYGLKVIQGSGGQEGISLAIRHVPDVILLDLMMPDMNGFEVVRRLRANESTAEIPIIIHSGKDLSQEDLKRINGKVQGVTSKPTKDDLCAELKKALNKSATVEKQSV